MGGTLQYDWPRRGDPGWRTPAPRPRRIAGCRRRVAAADPARPFGTGHRGRSDGGKVKGAAKTGTAKTPMATKSALDVVSPSAYDNSMILLIDIGNTHTHLGLANHQR